MPGHIIGSIIIYPTHKFFSHCHHPQHWLLSAGQLEKPADCLITRGHKNHGGPWSRPDQCQMESDDELQTDDSADTF